MNTSQSNNIQITDDFFRGLADSDGSIYGQARENTSKKQTKFISSSFNFELEQALYNQGNLIAVASHFGESSKFIKRNRKDKGRENQSETLVYCTNLAGAGKKIMEIYKEAPPSSPIRLRQYLITQTVFKNTKRDNSRTEVDLACTLSLLEFMSQGKSNSNLPEMRRKASLSPEATSAGHKKAQALISEVSKQVQDWEHKLKTNIHLSDEYIRGFHSGDGNVSIVYQVENNRVRFIPIWQLTNNSQELLIAVKNTKRAGIIKQINSNAFQFVVSSRDEFRNIVVPLFQNYKFPSEYKQQQWNRVYEAFKILETNNHLTSSQNWTDFIDLTYDISIVSKRKYSKEELYRFWDVNKGT